MLHFFIAVLNNSDFIICPGKAMTLWNNFTPNEQQYGKLRLNFFLNLKAYAGIIQTYLMPIICIIVSLGFWFVTIIVIVPVATVGTHRQSHVLETQRDL